MTSFVKMFGLNATTSLATLAVICLAGCHDKPRGRVATHARAESVDRLQTLVGAFSRALDEITLNLPENATNGTHIVIADSAMRTIVHNYNNALPNSSGTNIHDSWGKDMRLVLVFSRYETNSVGRLEPVVTVTAHSCGENRRDDAGKGDDLLVEVEMNVPLVVIKQGGSITASFETGSGGAAGSNPHH